MDTKQVLMMVAISAAVSLVVTGAVIYVGMRTTLPVIDTAQTRAVFDDTSAQQEQKQAA